MSDLRRPRMNAFGLKHAAHVANRAAKAMRDAGCSERLIEDMRTRVLDAANKWTVPEAIEIVREYVDVVAEPAS